MNQRLPSEIYIDASIVVAALFPGLPHSTACAHFCARLAAEGSYVGFSHVLRVELAQALRNLVTRRQLPEDIRQRFQLNHWGRNVLVRQRWFSESLRQFDAFLTQFTEWFQVDWDHHIWERSVEIMAVD